MERDVHVTVHGARQTGLAREECFWTARYRIGIELVVAQHADVALALGHEHRAVGQERQRERKRQRLGHHGDANVLTLARRVVERPVAERLAHEPLRRYRYARAEWNVLLGDRGTRSERCDDE